MTRHMITAALAVATVATILGGIGSYLVYRLAAHNGLWYVTLPGPFGGWHNTWLWASLAGFVVGLPRALYRAYRQGPGPRPGGLMWARGPADDVEYLRKVADWLERHEELVTAAAPGDRVHPPCLRCGREVTGFRVKPHALAVMRFKPCGCQVLLSRRLGRRFGQAGFSG